MQTRETRIVRQIRRGFGTWCTNSYMSDKTPSRCPLDASPRNAENVANAPQVFSTVYKPLHKKKVTSRCPLYADPRNADSEADTTGFWNVVYK